MSVGKMRWSFVVLLLVGATVVASMAVASVPGVPGTLLDSFTQAEIDGDWEADRRFPSDGATSVTAFGRDDVLRIGIDSTETAVACCFTRTEGIKTVGVGDFGDFVQIDLYLDPAWEDSAVRAGMWVAGGNGAGGRDAFFGILEFVNNEPCPEPDCTNPTNITDHEGFRIWDSTLGWSANLATDFDYGEWVTLGIELDAAAETYIYYIDGVEVGTAAGGENFIGEVFLNSYNYGLDLFPTLNSDSYAAHWHVGEELPIVWTTEVVSPDDMNEWAFGFDSGTDGSGAMVWGPDPVPAGAGSAYFELGDAATGYRLGTQGHDLPGTRFDGISRLEYSTYRSAGGAAQAIALQFNVDYDLTDATASWQGRLVYEPYYTQAVNTGEWQAWDTLTTGANWWSTGTPVVGDAAATKHCVIADPCTWDEVLAFYPDAGIHELPLGAVILKAGSAWAGFEGNADELKIATGATGTIFDFEPIGGLPPLLFCNGLQATIVGTEGDDVIFGTGGDDVIVGLGGNDAIYGLGGNDVICGGDGDDVIYGGEGDDILFGGAGNDTLYGGPGADVLRGGRGNDILYGGAGGDLLRGGPGNDELYGKRGHDRLKGGPGDDLLFGGRGNDRLNGGDGNDVLRGGKGYDRGRNGPTFISIEVIL